MTPGTRHFVRVNQLLQNNSWDASPTYYIDTIDCELGSPPAEEA